jgi:diguanylate cyclase (GGDEF)-like protein
MGDASARHQVLLQPIVDLSTGRVLAHEALTRPAGSSVIELFDTARVDGDVNAVDLRLALAAIDAAAGVPTTLHVNLLPSTLVGVDDLRDQLDAAVERTGREPHTLVIELTEQEPVADLVAAKRRCASLRNHGYAIAIDDVGNGHASLRLITALRPQTVKTDASIVADLPHSDEAAALLEALLLYCRRIGAQLVAEGIETEEQLAGLRSLGVGYGQGLLLAPPATGPSVEVTVPPLRLGAAGFAVPAPDGGDGPVMRDLARRAVTVPADGSGEAVRTLFSADDDLLTVVLVDPVGRPVGAVNRSRFMVAASGPFGHALNVRRSAAQHASTPRVVAPDTPVREAVGLVATRGGNRIYDDLVVVDGEGQCAGVVRVYDLLTAVHHAQLDTALTLHALTELPSGRAIEEQLRRRLSQPGGVAVHWIDIDGFKAVNDRLGFSGGDAVIKEIAKALRMVVALAPESWLGHVGGDDFVLLTSRPDAEMSIRGLLDRLPETDTGPISVSVATLDCGTGAVAEPGEVSRQLAPVKQAAKQVDGPAWAVGLAWDRHVRLHAAGPAAAR